MPRVSAMPKSSLSSKYEGTARGGFHELLNLLAAQSMLGWSILYIVLSKASGLYRLRQLQSASLLLRSGLTQ